MRTGSFLTIKEHRMKLVIGSDEASFDLKEQVKGFVEQLGHEVVDIGCLSKNPVLYPDIAETACDEILSGICDRGILVCGTGIGMALTANKIPGVRAAVGHDAYSVERSVLSNNCQVITFGARIVSYVYVTRMLEVWLNLTFVDSSSTVKINEIAKVEERSARRVQRHAAID